MTKTTYLCELSRPAMCEYRVDGLSSWTYLCGGCGLCDDIKKCPYRVTAQIIVDINVKEN